MWIEQVLVKREGLSAKEARSIAGRVDCGGEALYGLREGEWGDLCAGGAEEGKGWRIWGGDGKREERFEIGRRICGMLIRRRVEVGAIPVVQMRRVEEDERGSW